jgi:hypothetical protein
MTESRDGAILEANKGFVGYCSAVTVRDEQKSGCRTQDRFVVYR